MSVLITGQVVQYARLDPITVTLGWTVLAVEGHRLVLVGGGKGFAKGHEQNVHVVLEGLVIGTQLSLDEPNGIWAQALVVDLDW